MTGLAFVCACGDPDGAGLHSRRRCDLDQRARVAAAEAQRLAEFRARLQFVAAGLESALAKLDRSEDALSAMLRDVKAWSDSLGGGA